MRSIKDDNTFLKVGLPSVVAIFFGLFAREALGETLSNVFFVGGVVVGVLNVLYAAFW